MAARSDSVAEAVAAAARALAAAGCATPRLDAEVLFRHAAGGREAGWDEARLIAEARSAAPPAVLDRYESAVARRLAREPVAYITGEREFWSRPFAVDAGVLVPRPETEEVVALALRAARRLAPPRRIVDLGTGSGVLAITLALELAAEDVVVVAVDVSPAALAVARRNAARLLGAGAPARIAFARADLATCLAPRSAALVVANPPYLAAAELAAAEPELAFEPRLALLGGDDDGLGVVRRLLEESGRVLAPGGFLVSEIGSGQGAKVASLASSGGFEDVEIARDLAGCDRVLVARRRTNGGARGEEAEGSRGEDGWTRSSFEGGARSRARYGSAERRTRPSRSCSHRS